MEAKDSIIGILVLVIIVIGLYSWNESGKLTKEVATLTEANTELQVKSDGYNKAVAKNRSYEIALKKQKEDADREYNIFVKESDEREEVIFSLNSKVDSLIAQLMVDPAVPVIKELTKDEKLKALQLKSRAKAEAENKAGYTAVRRKIKEALDHERYVEAERARNSGRRYRRY